MRKVVLLHQSAVLHYRVAIYNRLSSYLREYGWDLTVIAESVQDDCPHSVAFDLIEVPGTISSVLATLRSCRPEAVIFFVNLKHPYLFPALGLCKLTGIRTIYWGHAIDLEHKESKLKNLLYHLEHSWCDALVLYADWLRRYVNPRHQGKVFIANNTIDTDFLPRSTLSKECLRSKLGIGTQRNLIFVGRLQRRKRVELLIDAFRRISDPNLGLVLIGPDTDGLMKSSPDSRILWVGPKYGDDLAEYMQLADVYCMPGHVGLSIVDAMFYGLPFVTTDVDHAPEIMYLRPSETGYIVQSDSPDALAATLKLLLDDDALRDRMGKRAIEVIRTEGSLETMFKGFLAALTYACGR